MGSGQNSNSSETLCLSWYLQVRQKSDKNKGAIVSKTFFLALKGNSELMVRSGRRDFMPILVTCKFDKDQIGNEGTFKSTFSPSQVWENVLMLNSK